MAVPCPSCHSKRTVWNGCDASKTPRVKCHDCGRTLTIGGRKPGGQPKADKLSRAEIQKNYRRRKKAKNNE